MLDIEEARMAKEELIRLLDVRPESVKKFIL